MIKSNEMSIKKEDPKAKKGIDVVHKFRFLCAEYGDPQFIVRNIINTTTTSIG